MVVKHVFSSNWQATTRKRAHLPTWRPSVTWWISWMTMIIPSLTLAKGRWHQGKTWQGTGGVLQITDLACTSVCYVLDMCWNTESSLTAGCVHMCHTHTLPVQCTDKGCIWQTGYDHPLNINRIALCWCYGLHIWCTILPEHWVVWYTAMLCHSGRATMHGCMNHALLFICVQHNTRYSLQLYPHICSGLLLCVATFVLRITTSPTRDVWSILTVLGRNSMPLGTCCTYRSTVHIAT